MAHSPEKKAAVIADLMAGGGIRETAKKHGIDHKTVSGWGEKIPQNSPPFEIIPADSDALAVARIERFNSALEKFMVAGANMSLAHAEMLASAEWIADADPEKLRPILEGVSRHWLAVIARL